MIYTEDAYGPDFFRRLVARLQGMGIGTGVIATSKKIPGVCWHKTEREIKASSMYYDTIIAVVDAEGGDRSNVHERLMSHVPTNIEPKVEVIIYVYMIEEWICKGFGIRFGNRPSSDLNDWLKNQRGQRHGYRKYMLPKFADEIDIEKLQQDSNFQHFIQALAER